jgi:DNA primase
LSRIPDSTIAEIRGRADIVGLVGRYVDLKQAGRNWRGLCPFHTEKTPSFNVNPDRQIFHCFGCQEGGDVIAFLMKHSGLSFPEAARSLASELGIDIPEEQGAGEAGLTARLFEANEIAHALYREALREPDGKLARNYLVSRGFDGKLADEFGIGYARRVGTRSRPACGSGASRRRSASARDCCSTARREAGITIGCAEG